MSACSWLEDMKGREDLVLLNTRPAMCSSIRGLENVLNLILTALKYEMMYFRALETLKPNILKS